MHGAQPEPNYLHRISHRRIDPPALRAGMPLEDVLDQVFLSYNAGRAGHVLPRAPH